MSVALITVGVGLTEWQTLLGPVAEKRVPWPADRMLYVVGDSLSANGDPPWAARLADLCQRTVVNLAQAGATAKNAHRQAAQVPADRPAIVVVEIGGNDLLAFTPSAQFEGELRRLLERLKSSGHTVLIVELPLLPGFNGYGRAQRRLAAQFGCTLISKRDLSAALGVNGATIDGLHLADAGHAELARRIATYLSPR
jgi:acyl-CoA thioesterase-1